MPNSIDLSISNGVKFTHHGKVAVAVNVQTAHPLVLHFAVCDSGIGIAPERISQLFHSFSQLDVSTTRRYGGTGLGLAISRRLTELMGGSMWVESAPQQGSTFHFTITTAPVTDLPPAAQKQAQSPFIANLATTFPCRILLVEDNIVNQKVALRILGRMGYDARVAANGKEAIAALQSEPFDFLLMDLHMPEMDGLEATRIIRQLLPAERQPLIVAVTAAALREDEQACLAAGMDAYITKPIRLERMAEVLRTLYHRRKRDEYASEG